MTNLDPIRKKFLEGDRLGARKDLVALFQSNPNDSEAWMLLAELVDEPERKRDCYRRVLKIDPGHLGAKMALARLDQPPEGQTPPAAVKPAPLKIETAPVDSTRIDSLRSDIAGKQPLGAKAAEAIDTFDQTLNRVIPARHQRAVGIVAGVVILLLVVVILWMQFGDALSWPWLTSVATSLGLEPVAPQSSELPASGATPTTPAEETSSPPVQYELRIYYAQETSFYCWLGGDAFPLNTFENQVRQAAISMDGELTALVADQTLWLVDCPNASLQPLVAPAQIQPAQEDPRYEGSRYYPRSLDWSPDGRFIFFDTIQTSDLGTFANQDLYSVEVSSGGLVELLPYGQGGTPHVSPDGKWVAAAGDRAISLVGTDGSNRVKALEFDEQPLLSWASGGSLPVVWLADSSAFLTALTMEDPSTPAFGQTYTIFRVSTLDGSATSLKQFNAPGGAFRFSPDGRFILYRPAGEEGASFGLLRLAEVDGEKDVAVAQEQPVQLAAWAPNSGGFAYVLQADRQLYFVETLENEENPLLPGQDLPRPLLQMTWLDDQHFLLLTGLGIYSGEVGQPLQALLPGDPGSTVILAAGYQPVE